MRPNAAVQEASSAVSTHTQRHERVVYCRAHLRSGARTCCDDVGDVALSFHRSAPASRLLYR